MDEIEEIEELKEKVMDLLNKNKALDVSEINKLAEINSLRTTKKVLEELIDELEISITNKKKYTIFENKKYKKGLLRIAKDGYGFVQLEAENDIFIPKRNLNGAIDGDIVLVEPNKKNKRADKPSGNIIKYKTRNKNFVLVATVNRNGENISFDLSDKKFIYNIILNNQSENINLVDGTKVTLKLKKFIDNNTYVVSVAEVLGHKDDVDMDLYTLIKENGVRTAFPEEVLKEVKKINDHVTLEDKEKIIKLGGLDLRDKEIFTIDCSNTKDIDDAISLEKLPNGKSILRVHIADVSYYVKLFGPIFKEACERGTSTYVPGKNVPMLPRELSNGICSLNPNAERLAITFEMYLDNDYNMYNFKYKESIIKSNFKMTYDGVNKILDKNEKVEDYEIYKDTLKEMNKIANAFRKKREDNGLLDFDFGENKLVLNKKGEVIDVILEERGSGQRMIEEFMIAVCNCIAHDMNEKNKNNKDYSNIYRVHEGPDKEKMQKFLDYYRSLGYNDIKVDLKELSSKDMRKILQTIKNKKESLILQTFLLRCMQKAKYSTCNSGHYALSMKEYTQATSPIRRLSDFIGQYLIKKNIYSGQTIKLPKKLKLDKLAKIATECEELAEYVEEKAKNMKIAEYMEKHIGEEYKATIIHIGQNNLFVLLPNLIEGAISFDCLDKEKFIDGMPNYKIGQEVIVKLVFASKELRIIKFEIVKELELEEENNIDTKKKIKKI